MRAVKYIIIFLIMVSCHEDDSIIIDNLTDQYVWPTNEWTIKDPLNLEMDKSYLGSLNTKINNGEYGNVHSLLIVKDGYLVFENYYNGSSSSQSHELQSATKSIASILCGIAIDQNYFTENDFVLSHLDNDYSHDNDPMRNSITIENVLNMQLGIDWNEWGYSSSLQDNIIMANSSDWIQYILNKSMSTNPNSLFLYNTGASTFISALINNKTPYTTENFSNQFLFNPIGIDSQDWWVQDSKGIVHTGGGLKLTAQDMARFGFLILQNGIWDEKQIISENYLAKIATPSTLNILSVPVNSTPQPLHYSHHWWNLQISSNGNKYDIIAAMGTGGQSIFIIKELNLVVVSTAWNLTEPNQTSSSLEWLKNYIIPSVQ